MEKINYIEDRTISTLESYSRYKEQYPKKNKSKGIEDADNMYLTEKEYRNIIKILGESISYDLIKSGKEIRLPSRLGSLQAMKVYPSKELIDFHLTKKLYGEHNKMNPNNKKAVKHRNRITKGTIPRLVYSTAGRVANFRHKTKYTFKFCRPNIRPNSYNKNNPELSLVPFFQSEGFRFYELYNPFVRISKGKKII